MFVLRVVEGRAGIFFGLGGMRLGGGGLIWSWGFYFL